MYVCVRMDARSTGTGVKAALLGIEPRSFGRVARAFNL